MRGSYMDEPARLHCLLRLVDEVDSMNWLERDAASVWHGFTQMDCYAENRPVIVERAEGRELLDPRGGEMRLVDGQR